MINNFKFPSFLKGFGLLKILLIIPYYFIQKNYIFGLIFKKFIKIYTIKIKNTYLKFDIPTLRSNYEYSCFFFKTYELNDLTLIKRWVKKGDNILVIGGGIGLTTAAAYYICKKKIYTSEINLSLNDLLSRNLRKNHVKFELVDKNIYFNKNKANKNYINCSKNFVESSFYKLASNVTKQKINNISFNRLQKKFQINFDTLIMDCEGYEFDILTNIAKYERVKKIIFELHPDLLGPKKTKKIFQVLSKNYFVKKDEFLNSFVFEKSD